MGGPSPLKATTSTRLNQGIDIFSESFSTDPKAQHAIPSEFLESGMHNTDNKNQSSIFSCIPDPTFTTGGVGGTTTSGRGIQGESYFLTSFKHY